jgi:hypothetical protein
MSAKDIFDDLQNLMVRPPEAEMEKREVQQSFPQIPEMRSNCETYAVVPLRLATLFGKELSSAQWAIFVHLFYHQQVLNKGHPISVTAKTTGCARHRSRCETIRRLERLGLIEVEWNTGKTAQVIVFTLSARLKKRRSK